MSDVVFGLVPKPYCHINHLDYGNPMIGYSSKWNVIEAVVWHRMIGTLWGTDNWFEAGNAATAYGVGVQSIDGAANDGLAIEWIDPSNGHYYGESSGPVSDPYGDGLLYQQRFGTSRVNPQSVAIEISGYETTPLTEKSRQKICELTAYYADRREIAWDEFPTVPDQDRSFVIWHQEITFGTGKTCPATVVMDETDELIARTAKIMQGYQQTDAPEPEPDFPAAEPFDSFEHGLETQTDQHDGDDLYQYLERRFTVAPERTGTCRVAPNVELEVIKTLPAGKQITSSFVTRQDNIDWILDTGGYAWKANAMNPKLTLPLKNQPV